MLVENQKSDNDPIYRDIDISESFLVAYPVNGHPAQKDRARDSLLINNFFWHFSRTRYPKKIREIVKIFDSFN